MIIIIIIIIIIIKLTSLEITKMIEGRKIKLKKIQDKNIINFLYKSKLTHKECQLNGFLYAMTSNS